MNRPFLLGFGSGIAVTALLGVGILLTRDSKPAPLPARPPAEPEELVRLRKEAGELREKLAKRPEPPAPPPAPVTPPQVAQAEDPAVDESFKEMQKIIQEKGFGALSDPRLGEVKKALDKSKAEAVRRLGEMLLHGKSAAERGIAAFFLASMDDPAAIGYLEKSLRDERDDFVRRCSSNVLARMEKPAANAALREAMQNDKDWGVRVNSAYGLAKNGDRDGLDTLVGYYDSQEAREFRVSILQAIADVAEPSTAPLFRKVLSQPSDSGLLLMAIPALGKMKDRESLPLLAAVIQDNPSESVTDAAKKAYNAIAGQDVYKD